MRPLRSLRDVVGRVRLTRCTKNRFSRAGRQTGRQLGGPSVPPRTVNGNSFRACQVSARFYVSPNEMWNLIKPRVSARQTTAPTTPRTPWHAVSIVSSAACCAAAMGLLGTRFLSKEAPRLPLKGCLMGSNCRCWYQHHEDRRVLLRRAPDLWNPGHARYVREERRRQRGRRSADLR